MALQLDLRPYRLRFRSPFGTAFGVLVERAGILVAAAGPEGPVGWGEAAPLPGFGGEALDRAASVLRRLADESPSWPPLESPAAIAALLLELEERFGDAPCARAAIEQALADRAAALAGLPLWRWLRRSWFSDDGSAAVEAVVAVNATLGADAPAAAAQQALAAVAAGFRTLKLKLDGAPERDAARLAAVRAAVGPQVALRADANGAWDEPLAERMLGTLAPLDLEYLEQPLPAAGTIESVWSCARGMARLRRLGVPLAADEILLAPQGPEAVLESGAADVWVLKPQLLGGLSAASRLAAAGRAAGLELVVTSAMDAAIGRMGALQLAAALGLRRACGLATGALLAEDLAEGPREMGGRVRLPAGPGLGTAPGRGSG